MDILEKEWNPCLTVQHILLSISQLMRDPNPYEPFNQDIADLYISDKDEYEHLAKQWT